MYYKSTCRKERMYGVDSVAIFILLFAKLTNESFIFGAVFFNLSDTMLAE